MFLIGLSKMKFICPGEKIEETIFLKENVSHSVSPMLSEVFLAIRQRFSHKLVKNIFFVSGGTIWERMVFLKNCIFYHFWIMIKKVSTFQQNTCARLSKTSFQITWRRLLRKKFLLAKLLFFYIRIGHPKKKFQPLDKSFRKDFEKSNLCVQRKILRVFLINPLFYLFQTTSKKFKVPVKNFSKGLSKSHSTCRQEFYEEKSLFSVRKLFHRFRILSEKVKSFGVVGFFARMKDAWKVL